MKDQQEVSVTQLAIKEVYPWLQGRISEHDMDERLLRILAAGSGRAGAVDSYALKHVFKWVKGWAANGMPRLTATHKLAASFMRTFMAPEVAAEIVPPWSCFMCVVPEGLLQPCQVAVLVRRGDDGYVRVIMHDQANNGFVNLCERLELFAGREVDRLLKMNRLDPEGRIDRSHHREWLRHAMRFILGCCAEIAAPHESAQLAQVNRRREDSRTCSLPTRWNIVFARQVSVDCRAVVRELVATGGRSAARATSQILVRGHWKRVVCGKGRMERRLEHIEPYWRGPEDAPIAVRSHVLVASEETRG